MLIATTRNDTGDRGVDDRIGPFFVDVSVCVLWLAGWLPSFLSYLQAGKRNLNIQRGFYVSPTSIEYVSHVSLQVFSLMICVGGIVYSALIPVRRVRVQASDYSCFFLLLAYGSRVGG